MVYQNLKIILLGIPISFALGVFSSILIFLEKILISGIPFCIKLLLNKKAGHRIGEFIRESKAFDLSSPISTFTSVITFFILFIILSYVLLFGQVRMYIFLIMLLGFLFSRRFFLPYLEGTFRAVFSIFIFTTLKITFGLVKTALFILKKIKFKRKEEKTIDKKAEIL